MGRLGPGTVVTSRSAPASGSAGAMVRVFADTEDHEHVQRRLGLLYGILGGIVAFFFVVGLIGTALTVPALVVPIHSSAPKVVHAGAFALLFAAWWICRGPLRSRWMLSVIDVGALVKCMSLVGMIIGFSPPHMRAEAIAIGPFLLIVMLRAALVPSTPRWTLLVTAIASLPIEIAIVIGTLRGSILPLEGLPSFAIPIMGVAWTVAGTFASWTISKVVYGLRSEVKNATKLGQYTLEEKIGEGGMGVVWRAKHALLRRPTAIKLLSADRTDASSILRFEREVQITSSLTHPNTVAIYDFGHTREGVFYYAMELLDGVTLQELVEEDGPQPPARVAYLLAQVASALAEAHDVGLVHRDVKPANVFVCERGGMPDFAKVLDFGLVKDQGHPDPALSTANAIAGTPLYMAPESITSPDSIDGRVDLYALGAVAYWLLTGKPPFEGTTSSRSAATTSTRRRRLPPRSSAVRCRPRSRTSCSGASRRRRRTGPRARASSRPRSATRRPHAARGGRRKLVRGGRPTRPAPRRFPATVSPRRPPAQTLHWQRPIWLRRTVRTSRRAAFPPRKKRLSDEKMSRRDLDEPAIRQ